jgi:cytochrome c oxidase subunit 3
VEVRGRKTATVFIATAAVRETEMLFVSRLRATGSGPWFAIGSILMLFVALTSAYIVRSASSNDWQPIAIPKVLWLSTVLILFSSVTIEISRRSLKQKSEAGYNRWLAVTTILGLGFLGSQLIAWRQLARQGIYVASNPYSSFFIY